MRRETFPIIIKRTTFRRDPQIRAWFLSYPTIRIGPQQKGESTPGCGGSDHSLLFRSCNCKGSTSVS